MIFNVPRHIQYIRNGLTSLPADNLNLPIELRIVKTETRRAKRGIYQVEAERKRPHETGYAVQRKRGIKAETDIRIVMDKIWREECLLTDELGHGGYFLSKSISKADAWAEGGYIPEDYEKVFRELNPKWNGWSRWAFEFYVIEVRKNVPSITSHAREERVKRTFYPEQTERYPRL